MTSHKKIFAMAWPYTLSMATSFIVQAVDSTMVAPMGTAALAALGVAGVSCFIPVSVTMGLITSVQKRVASTEHLGARHRALTGNMLLGLFLALPFVFLYWIFAHQIAALYSSGETVELAASYIRIFCPSFIFSSMNQALNGYWVGLFKSKTRLAITLSIAVVDGVGNLIFAPHFGLMGIGLASTLAIAFGFILNMVLVWRLEGYRWQPIDKKEISEDTKIIFGVTLHQVSLSLTLNAAVAIVGMISVEALAVANVVGILSLPALYIGIGYGVATGSFLIQSLAKKDSEETRRVAAMALRQVSFICALLGLSLILFSPAIRHWFFKDPAVFDLARIPFFMLATLFLIDGFGCALQRFHFVSDGVRKSFLIMTSVQWGLFIPGAFAAVKWGGIHYPTYLGLHLAQRILIAVILFVAWQLRLRKV